MISYYHNGWKITTFASKSKTKEFFSLINDNSPEYEILKSEKRSEVKLLTHLDEKYVLKIPKAKNKNRWIRFTTLYRNGEAYRCLMSMHKLKQLNIHTSEPVMVAEKKSFGRVIDSWLIYKYVEGANCLNRKEYYPEVVSTLETIHKNNCLHGDPQIRNFIVNQDKNVCVIDAKLKRPMIPYYSKNHEWAYLAKSAPGIESFFNRKEKTGYKFAKWVDLNFRRLVRKRRRIKNSLLNFLTTRA